MGSEAAWVIRAWKRLQAGLWWLGSLHTAGRSAGRCESHCQSNPIKQCQNYQDSLKDVKDKSPIFSLECG